MCQVVMYKINAYILLICLKSCRIMVILGSVTVQILPHDRSAGA